MAAEGTKEKEKGEAEPLATTKGAAEQLSILMRTGIPGEKQFLKFAEKEHEAIVEKLKQLNKANYRTKEGKLLVNSVNRRNVMLATVVVTAHKMFTFSGDTAITLKIALETTNEIIAAKVKELDMRLQEVEVEALDNPLMEKHLAGHAGVIDEMYKIHEKYHKSRQTKKYMPGRILFGRMLERATPALLALQAERKGKGPLEAEKREENVVTVVEPKEEKKEEQTKAPGEKKVTDLEKGKSYEVAQESVGVSEKKDKPPLEEAEERTEREAAEAIGVSYDKIRALKHATGVQDISLIVEALKETTNDGEALEWLSKAKEELELRNSKNAAALEGDNREAQKTVLERYFTSGGIGGMELAKTGSGRLMMKTITEWLKKTNNYEMLAEVWAGQTKQAKSIDELENITSVGYSVFLFTKGVSLRDLGFDRKGGRLYETFRRARLATAEKLEELQKAGEIKEVWNEERHYYPLYLILSRLVQFNQTSGKSVDEAIARLRSDSE